MGIVLVHREDFNIIIYPTERNNEGGITNNMRILLDIVDELNLCEIPIQGGTFT